MAGAAVPIADQFFTSANIAGVGVATLAVNVVTNTLHKLMGAPPKWTAFITALVIAYVVVAMGSSIAWHEWIFAFVNGCLLFCSAMGLNEFGANALASSGQGFAKTRPIIKSWFN